MSIVKCLMKKAYIDISAIRENMVKFRERKKEISKKKIEGADDWRHARKRNDQKEK